MLIIFWKNLIVMTKFPDVGQIAKHPDNFFSKFPDLEKILFSPGFSRHVATLILFVFLIRNLSMV